MNTSTRIVFEFLLACHPDRSRSEIERLVASIADNQIVTLAQDIIREVTSDNTRYSAQVFARNGWFMDMQFPAAPAPKIADLYEKGQSDKADDILCNYYRGRIASITSNVVARYGNRRRILTKAFRSHREGDYDVAIPLFLIHADGICVELFGREFFRIKERRLLGPTVDKREGDWIWHAVAEPLRIVSLPIARHCVDSQALNRHVILHGRSLNYGTEINSLKAISLLSFLHGLDKYAHEKQAESCV